MLPNTPFPADLVTFTEETLNEKLQFFVQCLLLITFSTLTLCLSPNFASNIK